MLSDEPNLQSGLILLDKIGSKPKDVYPIICPRATCKQSIYAEVDKDTTYFINFQGFESDSLSSMPTTQINGAKVAPSSD